MRAEVRHPGEDGRSSGQRKIRREPYSLIHEGRPVRHQCVTLTGKILGSEGNIPDCQDDRGDEPNHRLRHDYEPSSLKVIRYESPAPDHDNSDRTSAYRQFMSWAGTHRWEWH